MTSRVANSPVPIVSGVTVTISGQQVVVKGPKGELSWQAHELVGLKHENEQVIVEYDQGSQSATIQAGTTRALVNNMVVGVSAGFERKLQLVGVGYKAALKGKQLILNVGYSHLVEMEIPEGLVVEVPSPTELLVKGADKQKVGQFSAMIRKTRPPEPYKGKGVRYADEVIVLKEGKKK